MHQLDTRHISPRGQHSIGSGYSESGTSILKRFSSSCKTKAWLTWSRAAKSTALRLPKAPFNQHFMRLQNQWGGSISFSCPVPHCPPNWKSQGPLGFYFSYIWATAEINTSFLRWFRQNVLWFKALCKKGFRHKSKNASKKTCRSKQFGGKKNPSKQAIRCIC